MAQDFSAQSHFPITASASGANTVITGQTGYRIRVISYVIVGSGTVNAKWQSGSTDLSGLLYLGQSTGVAAPEVDKGHFETNSGESLNLNLSAATAVGGHITVSVFPG